MSKTAEKESSAEPANAERRALKVAIYGALSMSVLGLLFAWKTSSEAILLDGVFSGISFVMALLTMEVSRIITRPDDEHLHYGYAHFAPLLNVIKSLVMIVLCGFALASAVSSLLEGGRPLQVGSAVIYGLISTVGCIGFAAYLHRAHKRTGSVLVALDAKAWIIDAMMSGAVLLSFIGGWFLATSQWAEYLDYVDPLLVVVLCLIALPIPLIILVQNGREVLLYAPDRALQEQVDQLFRDATEELEVQNFRIRMVKFGNTLNIMVHAQLPDHPNRSLKELDEVRRRFSDSLHVLELRSIADVLFVGDMALAD